MIETKSPPAPRKSEAHLAAFDRLERQGIWKNPSWVFPLRKAALAHFAEQGFPTLKDEDWRFTNVAPIASLPFKPAQQLAGAQPVREVVEKFPLQLQGSRLVFVDGHFVPEFSRVAESAGIRISPLSAALSSDHALIEKHLARQVSGEANAFAALNTAFFQDGVFIHVAEKQAAAQPVHCLYFSSAAENGATTHVRNLVIAERHSRLTWVESYVSLGGAAHVTNTAAELIIGEESQVEYCKFQDENLQSFHIASLKAQIARGARFHCHSISTGARLARHNLNTVFNGPGIECVLNGLYLVHQDQLADHHMIVDHAQPHCNSHEYFNGILNGQARGVFHGRILVRPDAQKTDAKQTNKNLLLSDNATVDTKPQLEIYADDVKCTHGATIGQLNDEAIFYLRARGISLEEARRMLIHAFAGEIMDRIQCEPLREQLDQLVWDRLEQTSEIAPHGR